MRFGERIRNIGYWTVDFMTGGQVRKNYLDIKNIMENYEDTKDICQQYLDNMLRYAVKNVPYYKKYEGYTSLQDFPVINKEIMKQNYDDFQSPEFLNKKVITQVTSGTTGQPLKIRQNVNKRKRIDAEMMYFYNVNDEGYKVGMRYVFYRVWTDFNQPGKFACWFRNTLCPNVVTLDEKKLENMRQTLLKDHKIEFMMGYAGTIDSLVTHMEKCGDTPDKFSIKQIMTISELLREDTREKLKKVFGCKVVSLYSNKDNGQIAIECGDANEFHVNTASFHIELLKMDSDEPAEDGELARVVITDMFNFAMPFIRYDTGDLAVGKAEAECSWKTRVFERVEGRKNDLLFTTTGDAICPLTWINEMHDYEKLKQYQFLQEDEKSYVMCLVDGEEKYDDNEMTEHLKRIVGSDADIQIKHVSKIEIPESGKMKYAINNYKKR